MKATRGIQILYLKQCYIPTDVKLLLRRSKATIRHRTEAIMFRASVNKLAYRKEEENDERRTGIV